MSRIYPGSGERKCIHHCYIFHFSSWLCAENVDEGLMSSCNLHLISCDQSLSGIKLEWVFFFATFHEVSNEAITLLQKRISATRKAKSDKGRRFLFLFSFRVLSTNFVSKCKVKKFKKKRQQPSTGSRYEDFYPVAKYFSTCIILRLQPWWRPFIRTVESSASLLVQLSVWMHKLHPITTYRRLERDGWTGCVMSENSTGVPCIHREVGHSWGSFFSRVWRGRELFFG